LSTITSSSTVVISNAISISTSRLSSAIPLAHYHCLLCSLRYCDRCRGPSPLPLSLALLLPLPTSHLFHHR
jgi:hypothetical protein